MAEDDRSTPKPETKQPRDARQERLAQALRSNLLKRKENTRAKRTRPEGPEEGGQG